MISESKSEPRGNTAGTDSLGTVLEFVKNLEEQANDMDTHGWMIEAANLRKWAFELRAHLAAQNYSPGF
jgi:hypothetical protein